MTVFYCHRQAPSDATFWCSHMLSSCDAWRGRIHLLRLVLSRCLGTYFLASEAAAQRSRIDINYGYCGAEAGYGSAILTASKVGDETFESR
jgi:hypothetical protein